MKNYIKYVQGDLFKYVDYIITTEKDIKVVIPHVCNNQGGFGSGFVYALNNKYPIVRDNYKKWFNGEIDSMNITLTGPFRLGECQFVKVHERVTVVNMIAQTLGGSRPLSYKYLSECMSLVTEEFDGVKNMKIIAPMFGSGLAGGNWNFIEELILDHWSNQYDIQINYLKDSIPSNWTPPPKGFICCEERP